MADPKDAGRDREIAGLRGLIRAKRSKLGWSQEELASVAGVSAATIASLEQGRRGASSKVVHDLAIAFGVSDQKLLDVARRWADAEESESGGPERDSLLSEIVAGNAATELPAAARSMAGSVLASDPVAEDLALTALMLRRAQPSDARRLLTWLDEVARRLAATEEVPATDLLSWALELASSPQLQRLSPEQRDRLVESLRRFGRDDLTGEVRIATMPAGEVRYVFTTAVGVDDNGVLWIDPLARALPSGYDAEDPRVERWDTGQVILDTSRLASEPRWSPRDPERHLTRITPQVQRLDVGGDLETAYRTTVIEIGLGGDPGTVSPSDPTSGQRLPEGVGHVHVITAYNPRSRLLSTAENEERNRLLRADLERAGYRFHPALGHAPDDSWREPSFAVVDAPEDEIVELAARYEQNAVYRWDREGVRTMWTSPV